MYLIGVFIFLIIAGFVMVSFGSMVTYLDLFSLFVIIMLVIPMLVASGAHKDFNRAFRFALNKTVQPGLEELKKAKEAVTTARKLIILSGILDSLISMICILARLDDVAYLGPNVAVAILSLMYAVILNVILVPIEHRLKSKVIECGKQ